MPKESQWRDLLRRDLPCQLSDQVWTGLPGMKRGRMKLTVIATHAVSA
jgi:hypothetical protein